MEMLSIDHVGLSVRNVKASAKFFIDILGFQKIGEKPEYPAIFIGNKKIRLTLWQADTEALNFDRRRHIGLHHLAFAIEDSKMLDDLHQALKTYPDVHIEFEPQIMGEGPSKHMMVYEPGGNRIEFTLRVPTQPIKN